MNILTFDTTLNKTYIALNDFCKTIENKDDKYHSAFLIQEIANILKDNKLTMEDINAIGINVGPGSFTGIRACTTVGRVIAQQMNIPLVPVSSMEILSKISTIGKTMVTLDARKNSAYVAIYEQDKELQYPKIVTQEELVNLAKSEGAIIVSDTSMHKFLKENDVETINYEVGDYPLNKYLMDITKKKLEKSSDYNWAKVKPLYIQQPSIFGK